ncbi:DUF2236 domain-containing protein [Alcanivorax sp. S6407]|uniref:oxygenase MpaB family protein n=1 Tax=Alcanivorax sp. S6407 TaxID=2926424 RepID=UPI001FF4F845|nr:oxygenase MpaB family protein [Alcanivorax sp. S6407]MCK0153392.1 DUF2236 domain-containing protein [Alcanivorax sp. S6407]
MTGHTIPTAARMLPWQKAGKRWLPDMISKWIFGRPLPPSRAEWEQLNIGLFQGDPAMDAVVQWMFAYGPREAKALFEQALENGVDSLDNPPQAIRDFFTVVDRDPEWLDRALLERGVSARQLGSDAAFYVLRDFALMGGYVYFNSMNQTLSRSGSLHKDVSLRLAETGTWLLDVTSKGGMKRYAPGFASTIKVRMIHALIRHHLGNQPQWDTRTWGLPINQVDMQATYLAFGPASLSGCRLFGVPFRRQDSRAIMHLWRYIGWLMGVDESRLATTEGDGLRKLYHTFLTHGLPDDKIRQMGQALAEEPLKRHLGPSRWPGFAEPLRRRYLRAVHLSNASMILGFRQRRQLGLPLFTLPWFPLITAPFRFLNILYHRIRGGRTLAMFRQQQQQRQQAELQQYFGERQQSLLQPDKEHPAHLK